MLRTINNIRAQAIMGEYVLVFFMVAAVMTAMTVFFKRAVQGRIRDARVGMELIIANHLEAEGYPLYWTGNMRTHYEPYYANSSSLISRDTRKETQLFATPGFSSGLFLKIINEASSTKTLSNTAPPKDAD